MDPTLSSTSAVAPLRVLTRTIVAMVPNRALPVATLLVAAAWAGARQHPPYPHVEPQLPVVVHGVEQQSTESRIVVEQAPASAIAAAGGATRESTGTGSVTVPVRLAGRGHVIPPQG